MRKTLITAATAAVALGIGSVAVAGGFQYRTTATGEEEVPVRSTTAEAKLNLKVDRGGEQATYNLRITEPIVNLTMAHLHVGPVGSNGPVAVWLYPSAPPLQLIPGTTEGRVAKGSIEAASLCYSPTAPYCSNGAGDWSAFVADLDAGRVYLNVHTSQFPGGEVRGQVHSGQHG